MYQLRVLLVFVCEIHVPAKGVAGIVCEIHVPAKGVPGIFL